MLAAKVAPAAILYSTAIPAAVAGVAILLLGRRMRRVPTTITAAPTKSGSSTQFSLPEAEQSGA